MTILVVAAHPDDEVLGCGGTIAKISGDRSVHVAILGEGITSRTPQRSEADISLVEELQENARAAAKLLGVDTDMFGSLPDNRFDQLPLLEVVKRVERLIEDLSPTIVYTHHPGDLNVDHRVAFQAVLTATRPVNACSVRDIFTFGVPSSTEWAFQQLQPAFKPNVFEDIASTMETKLKGMECYNGEVRSFPHPRSLEALRTAARHWGSVVGLEYAEPFELVRSIRS